MSLSLLLAGCSNAVGPPPPDTTPPAADTADTADTGAGIGRVVLNEVLADNRDGITNELDDHEDWIELHNAGTAAVDLAGWGLMDGERDPWIIEGPIALAPGAFLLIWCDDEDDEDLTGLHADFKLDRDGEVLTIIDAASGLVDVVQYPELEADQSWGRTPDGGEDWAYMVQPTPGEANF